MHKQSGDKQVNSAAAKIACILLFWTVCVFAINPVRIILFPLDAASPANNMAWLSEGIPFSLSYQLSGPGVQVVDREERLRLVESLDLPPDAHLSHGSVIRVAQEGKADLIILGSFSGTDRNLRVTARILDVKDLKLSGEITVKGPLAAVAQMENELGWLILNNTGLQKGMSRADFSRRQRKIPNVAYSAFIKSFSAGRNEQFRLLNTAVEGFKEFPEAHFQLGRLYFQKGDCNNALRQLSMSARDDDARSPENEFIRGTCLVQQDQPTQAIQSLSKVLASSRSFRLLNNIGVAHLRKGDTAQALNAFTEARNIARSDVSVTVNMAIARHLKGEDVTARNILEEAVRSHPKNGMLHFLSGFILKKLGEHDLASAAFAKAKGFGMNTDKLQLEDPRTWCLVHTIWEK